VALILDRTPEPVGGVAALFWSADGSIVNLALERDDLSPLQWLAIDPVTGSETYLEGLPEWDRQPLYFGILLGVDFYGFESPTGRYLLEAPEPLGNPSGRSLWLVDRHGASTHVLLTPGRPQDTLKEAQWLADETMVAFIWAPHEYGAELYLYDLQGRGSALSVAEMVPPSDRYAGVLEWRLAPNGDWIAVSDDESLWILSMRGQQLIRVTGNHHVLVWSHDGRLLFSYRHDSEAGAERSSIAVDTVQRNVCTVIPGPDLELIEQLGIYPTYAYDVSPDVRRIALADYEGDLAIVQLRVPNTTDCLSVE
jgi:hypothetical protein